MQVKHEQIQKALTCIQVYRVLIQVYVTLLHIVKKGLQEYVDNVVPDQLAHIYTV